MESGMVAEDRRIIRERLALAARYLHRRGFVMGNVGNFSHRIDEETIMIKPTGITFRGFTPRDFSMINVRGKLLFGSPPSGEWRLHSEIYGIEDDSPRNVIIHTHPPQVKSMFRRVEHEDAQGLFDKLDDEESEGLKNHGIAVIPKLSRYSEALAHSARKAAEGKNRILILWSHGLVAIGETIDQAVNLTEGCCEICDYL